MLLSRPVEPQLLDDAIPAPIVAGLLQIVPHLRWEYGWSTEENKDARYWHHEIARGRKENTEDVRPNVALHPAKVLLAYIDWLQHQVIGSSILLRYYFNGQTYGTDGSPHTDSDRQGEVTAVTYLTTKWNPVWAGSTVIYDGRGDVCLSALPRANRVLLFPSDRLHGPEPLSRF